MAPLTAVHEAVKPSLLTLWTSAFAVGKLLDCPWLANRLSLRVPSPVWVHSSEPLFKTATRSPFVKLGGCWNRDRPLLGNALCVNLEHAYTVLHVAANRGVFPLVSPINLTSDYLIGRWYRIQYRSTVDSTVWYVLYGPWFVLCDVFKRETCFAHNSYKY